MLDPNYSNPVLLGNGTLQHAVPGVSGHIPHGGMHESGQVPYVLVPFTALHQIPGYGGAMLQAPPHQPPHGSSRLQNVVGQHSYPAYDMHHAAHHSARSSLTHTPHPPAYPPDQEPSHMTTPRHHHMPRPPPSLQLHPSMHAPQHMHHNALPDHELLAERMENMNMGPGKRNDKLVRRKAHKDREAILEEARQRTIYASDIDKSVTEADLAQWFQTAGQLIDCRICSDLNACKRFAFVEFADRDGFEAGLKLAGLKMGNSTLKVSPSKTAIVPINPSFMPRDGDEVERCSRTVYINQIDPQVSDNTVRQMFQGFCGSISRFKMKADKHHGTRIAFIEFDTAEAAKLALGMCGAQLGSSQLRVSPSKTPVRIQKD